MAEILVALLAKRYPSGPTFIATRRFILTLGKIDRLTFRLFMVEVV
jgi:hypothetical protein